MTGGILSVPPHFCARRALCFTRLAGESGGPQWYLASIMSTAIDRI